MPARFHHVIFFRVCSKSRIIDTRVNDSFSFFFYWPTKNSLPLPSSLEIEENIENWKDDRNVLFDWIIALKTVYI